MFVQSNSNSVEDLVEANMALNNLNGSVLLALDHCLASLLLSRPFNYLPWWRLLAGAFS